MKLLLLSFNQTDEAVHKNIPTDISALGTRYLSASLKHAGVTVKTLFLCKAFGEEETDDELAQIAAWVGQEQPDLLGCSLMSNHALRAARVTQYLKRHDAAMPIIWGGAHPTLEPEACLQWADMVCLGEGEEPLNAVCARIAAKQAYDDIPGIWSKTADGGIVKNPTAPLQEDLDVFPFPDYDFADHVIIHDGTLQPLTASLYRQYYPASSRQHRIMTTRGCPYACSYCCNSAFRTLYSGQYLRRRSVDNVIRELEAVKRRLPFVEQIKIMDDSFIMGKPQWIEEFAREYKARIDLPFFCLLSPSSVTREKIGLLVDAGLRFTQIGLQTGSDRVNREIYQRRMTRAQFVNAANIVAEFYPDVQVVFDVIVDNPYETEDDVAETVKTLAQVPRPFGLGLFSLAFYPHTALYERARADGMIHDYDDEYIRKQFHRVRGTYLNKLIRLTPRLSQEKVLWFLTRRASLSARLIIALLHWGWMQREKFPSSLKDFIKQRLS